MSEKDIRRYSFDVEDINWNDYVSNVHIPGLRRYVMKGRSTATGSKFDWTKREISK